MKITIDGMYAKHMMRDWGRDYFTTTARDTIIEYYDEVDENTEFDPVAICCEWNEYGEGSALTINDFMNDYGYLLDDEDEDKKTVDRLLEIIEDHTYVTRLDNDNILLMTF